jgi:23S rRNA (pseudouridine1915-N3)-methyltransferase
LVNVAILGLWPIRPGNVYDTHMKLHLTTVGEPKLAYARAGWKEYLGRLKHYHQVRVTHVPDKYAYDAAYLLAACGKAYRVVMEITGKQFSSPDLAAFLEKRALDGRELCLLIGGPEGLPAEVIAAANEKWSLSALTLPHDLAMVVTLEALYRASTITAGHPYHK